MDKYTWKVGMKIGQKMASLKKSCPICGGRHLCLWKIAGGVVLVTVSQLFTSRVKNDGWNHLSNDAGPDSLFWSNQPPNFKGTLSR